MKHAFNIDFTELSKNRSKGYGFQALVREVGFHLGYDVEPSGTGPDEAKDLIFVVADKNLYEKTLHRRWLVSCKDNSVAGKSVKSQDLTKSGSLKDRAEQHNCTGFLLACTTDVVDDARRMLKGLDHCQFFTHVWDGDTIRRILHEHEEKMMLSLIRFFPKSYASTSQLPLIGELLENFIELVEAKDNDRFLDESDTLIERIQDIASSTDRMDVKLRLGESILWRLYNTGESINLLYPFLDEWVNLGDSISDAFIHALITYIEDSCVSEIDNNEGDEKIKLEEESGVALSKSGNQFLIHVPIVCKKGNKKKLEITVNEDDYSCEIVNVE